MASTILPAVLQPGVTLGSGSTNLCLAPPLQTLVVKRAVFSNAGTSPAGLTVTVTRAGGSPIPVVPSATVPANSTYLAPELSNLVLAPGDSLDARAASSSSITCVASGFTIS